MQGTHPIIYGSEHGSERRLDLALSRWLDREEPSVLNAGEVADSLAIPEYARVLADTVIPFFADQTRHTLLLVTKSSSVDKLLAIKSTPQVIVSFSLNALPVAARWEKGAPGLYERLAAAKELKRKGWRLRIRIDPMIPIQSWERWYAGLAGEVNRLGPERVTLGSLRALPGLSRWAPSDVWEHAPRLDGADRRRRVPMLSRLTMYTLMKECLEVPELGLCKETRRVWNALGFDPLNPKCNCIL